MNDMLNPESSTEALGLNITYSSGFLGLLRKLNSSLVVTTYQAGKVVVLRAEGDCLNAHLRTFQRPMGLAIERNRFSIGTQHSIEEFRNIPAAAEKLEPAGKHDAAFMLRRRSVTGDIDVHEMSYASDGKLWFVNSLFSCLCTLDGVHSFVPEWRPPFVSAYSPTDRCHLNGLAMRDGKPRYVTSLGKSDTDQGWRARKADGGVLMDIVSNGMLLDNLSMPHSPRWYQGRLWLLESGRGGVCWLESDTGRLNTLATLPGFTRGLAFAGPLAFVGVSQVRESATFSGIPITSQQEARNCGVWVIDLRNGKIVAFLRFEDRVQEIFAVAVLQGIRFPEIVNEDKKLLGLTYTLPPEALKDVAMPGNELGALGQAYKMGLQHRSTGHLENAVAAFRKSLELMPDFLPARIELGLSLLDQGQHSAAIVELECVVKAESAEPRAHSALGMAYVELGKFNIAEAHFRRALELQPNMPEALAHLGFLLLSDGRIQEGYETLECLLEQPKYRAFSPRDCAQWNGQKILDRSLLVFADLNQIEFRLMQSFLISAAERVGRLLIALPAELHADQVEFPANVDLLELDDAFDVVKNCTAWLPIWSLPKVL